MKILVIATHPDDEILGCGGTLARHAACGDDVQAIVVTQGAEDIYSHESEVLGRKELKRAHKIVGIKKCHFLDFPAPKLDIVPNYKIADSIKEVLTSFGPSIVYLPHRGDIHVDHRAVYQATLVAARPTRDTSIKKMLCYETLSETDWAPPSADDAFIPTVFVDISPYIDIKMQAMECYKSQLKEPPHSRSIEALRALARLRGSTIGFEWAETFMLVRERIGL
jgi:LmbE family N-acetylglucosaminyl deacetylase